jgi:RNA polymerase sigma factor (sigma-70 family)
MEAPSASPISETAVPRPEFQTTHWSLIIAAQGESLEARVALEKLCRTYWYPLYAFVRREGHSADEAQDLTQAFFARLIERRDLDRAQREKGRLRSFLLVSLKNFLINEWHRARAAKRGGGETFVALDELNAEQRYSLEPVDALSADRIYERRWALTLLDHVMVQLESESTASGNRDLFAALKPALTGEENTASQAELAARFGMTENALKQALFRLRQRYRILLRAEIANTVATPGEVEDELRFLIAALRN